MKRFYIILAMISIMTVVVGCDSGASDKAAVAKAEGTYNVESGNRILVAFIANPDGHSGNYNIYLCYKTAVVKDNTCTMYGDVLYTIDGTKDQYVQLAKISTSFTYDVDTSSERTWKWNTNPNGNGGHNYLVGQSQYKGYDVTITWGATTISPSSVDGATFMNDNKILPARVDVITSTTPTTYALACETWQNGNQIDVSGRYWSIDTTKVDTNGILILPYTRDSRCNQQVYPNGAKTYTVANIFDSSTTFAHGDNFGDTVTGHAGIFIGITGTYNSYHSKTFVYTTTDESTEAGRLIGCCTKFYK